MSYELGNPLGPPIGGGGIHHTGEEGKGVGLSGGHGVANASNTQHAQFAQQEQSGFNSGLGGDHASGGLPSGHSSHPIADKFTSGNNNSGYTGSSSGGNLTGGHDHTAREKLDNSLDKFSGNDRQQHEHGEHQHQHQGQHQGQGLTGGAPRGDAVSGAYAGSGAGNALTGESHATRTGAGVGPLGENLDGNNNSHHNHSHGGALAAGAGAAGIGAAGASSHDSRSHNNQSNTNDYNNNNNNDDNNRNTSSNSGATRGHFGTEEKDFDRGAPVSDPKHLESEGRHGLVFKDGKYVHRHELEDRK